MSFNLQIGISFHLCFIHSLPDCHLRLIVYEGQWFCLAIRNKMRNFGKTEISYLHAKDFPTTFLAISAKIFIVDKNTPLKMLSCWSIAPKMFWGLVWVVKGDSEVLLRVKFVFYKSYCSNISCVCTTVRLCTQLCTHILHCVVSVLCLPVVPIQVDLVEGWI